MPPGSCFCFCCCFCCCLFSAAGQCFALGKARLLKRSARAECSQQQTLRGARTATLRARNTGPGQRRPRALPARSGRLGPAPDAGRAQAPRRDRPAPVHFGTEQYLRGAAAERPTGVEPRWGAQRRRVGAVGAGCNRSFSRCTIRAAPTAFGRAVYAGLRAQRGATFHQRRVPVPGVAHPLSASGHWRLAHERRNSAV